MKKGGNVFPTSRFHQLISVIFLFPGDFHLKNDFVLPRLIGTDGCMVSKTQRSSSIYPLISQTWSVVLFTYSVDDS